MAKLMKKRAKVYGSREVKNHTDKVGESREVGKPRKTDGTSVSAVTGLVLTENYQSIRVEVGITIPTTFDKRREAMNEAWEFADAELAEKLDDAKKLLKEI